MTLASDDIEIDDSARAISVIHEGGFMQDGSSAFFAESAVCEVCGEWAEQLIQARVSSARLLSDDGGYGAASNRYTVDELAQKVSKWSEPDLDYRQT
jgi:hypothetical protein